MQITLKGEVGTDCHLIRAHPYIKTII